MTAQVGFGLAAVGRPAYITTRRSTDLGDAGGRSVAYMRGRAHDLLDVAWDLGIRYIDVARSYGLAEQFLGSWLARHPNRRGALTVGSKWGYEYVGGWRLDAPIHERKEHSLMMFERQWSETVEALGGPPDFYLIHSVTSDSPSFSIPALLERLHDLTAAGVRVGFSTSGPAQVGVIRAALSVADHPFSVVQSTWNVFEPSVGEALDLAHADGWSVVIKEVLANGELTNATTRSDAHRTAESLHLDVDELALGAALGMPFADIVLSGATTAEHLRRATTTSPIAWARATPLAVSAAVYWDERSRRAWT